jgi:exodeoxyribonuclease VIII
MKDDLMMTDEAADLPSGTIRVSGAAEGAFRVENLPAPLYHCDLERHSCSLLKHMLVSPAHYMQQSTAHAPSSPAMEFGSLVHLLILEPQQLPFRYAVIPGSARPSAAERREAQALYPGLQILTEVQLHEARIAAEKVMHRQVRGRPFQRFVEEGLREVTFFYRDPVTELPCRVRMDLWHPDAIFDLKTTRHIEVADFSRACLALHYDLQAYMYCLADARFEGRDCARDFVFLAVQSERPHPVHVLASGASFMANGEAKYVRAMAHMRACAETDFWPDNSTDGTLEILPWQAFEASASSRADNVAEWTAGGQPPA